MARAGGTAGGGMGGGPDSAPGGSSAAGPGTAGPGNAPGQGMGADAFGGGRDSSQMSAKEFKEALHRAVGLAAPVSPEDAAIAAAVEKNREFRARQAPATNPAYDPQEVEAQVMGTRQRSPSVDLNQVESNVPFDAGAEDDPDSIGRAMQEKGAFLDDREAIAGAASPSGLQAQSPAYGEVNVGAQVMGSPIGGVSLDDPQGTEKGLTQAEIAQRSFDLSTPAGFREQERVRMGMPSLTDRTLSPEEGAEVDRLLKAYREAQTPFGRTIRAILDTYRNYSTFGLAAKGIKAALDKLGFNVNPGIVEQAIRNVQEINTQGARGAGGVSVGSRNDGVVASMLESGQLNYVEPWMRGLSDQQIQYYLDRPSELEWVRSTWSKAFGMPSKYN